MLDVELNWLARVLDTAVRLHFGQPCDVEDVTEIPAPGFGDDSTEYAQILRRVMPSFDERLVLILALAPYLRPQLLDLLLLRNERTGRGFTEFGGMVDGPHAGFWPTFETAAFLVGGTLCLQRRLHLARLMDPAHPLQRDQLLHSIVQAPAQNGFAAPLRAGSGLLSRLLPGMTPDDALPGALACRRMTTSLDWGDLVLPQDTREDVQELLAWIRNADALRGMGKLARHIGPGCRSFFHGQRGTGKSLTAALLGKVMGQVVYRVDTRQAISEVSEAAEASVARLFDDASRHRWILYFDEADALFREPGGLRLASHGECGTSAAANRGFPWGGHPRIASGRWGRRRFCASVSNLHPFSDAGPRTAPGLVAQRFLSVPVTGRRRRLHGHRNRLRPDRRRDCRRVAPRVVGIDPAGRRDSAARGHRRGHTAPSFAGAVSSRRPGRFSLICCR
ncbi:AAA family ATPase [Bordetella ansorpii]|uniref:AAA family ATPase n=1 Tax=Bordetella ansorpii TaxID=288768 RepID=UPI00139016F9|nr:AAA family ATPase [Bordetella ansorpii]